MKQLQMTPQIAELINKAVGSDVDTSKLAVFETIALNTKPLPGKRGTIFENAVVQPVTLAQMVDHINAGNHLPLIADHELFGAPMGRVFHAGLDYGDDNEMEMRALFYLDETETTTIAKLNSGSLDEVSVAFLSSAFLCSDCGWDYFAEGSEQNIYSRTCANGHTIGENGVHANMIGLNQFLELSLVARGAADNPKIVGKSQSKLAPETTYRLAAKGFTPDALVVYASLGKEDFIMDTAKLVADLMEVTKQNGVLTASEAALKSQVATLTAERDTAVSQVATLTTERDEARNASSIPEDYEPTKTELGVAITFLQEQLNGLRVAKGEAKLEGDALPKDVAGLKSAIADLTAGLTAILPVEGRSNAAGSGTEDSKPETSVLKAGFSTRK